MKNEKSTVHAAGEGIRSVKTTNVFRVVNFELYAKPVNIATIDLLVKLYLGRGYIHDQFYYNFDIYNCYAIAYMII